MSVSGVEVIVQGQASASAEIVATTSADAAIVGKKGDQGPAGPAGPVGPSGPTGQEGPAGPYHTFVITVANPGYGNRYYIDSNLTPVITGVRGFRYIFDQSDSSNSSHDFALSLTDGGTHEAALSIRAVGLRMVLRVLMALEFLKFLLTLQIQFIITVKIITTWITVVILKLLI